MHSLPRDTTWSDACSSIKTITSKHARKPPPYLPGGTNTRPELCTTAQEESWDFRRYLILPASLRVGSEIFLGRITPKGLGGGILSSVDRPMITIWAQPCNLAEPTRRDSMDAKLLKVPATRSTSLRDFTCVNGRVVYTSTPTYTFHLR